jgi:16S rRNA (cytosine967-C5)-methyltransferase
MKLHPPLYKACEGALARIFNQNEHAEKVVDSFLKSERKWGARDRRHFAETVYDLVRSWRLYLKLNNYTFGETPVTSDIIKHTIDTYLRLRENSNELAEKTKNLQRKERESVPDWLDIWGEEELGEKWEPTLHALNQKARQYLRVNSLKTNIETLRKKLNEAQIETEVVTKVPSALVLRERKNVFLTESYRQGFFEMQDAGSQLIAPFLKVEPGMRVIDACAGAGGKSLHIAMLMKNKGQIIALDIHEWKLNELKLRARRAGVSLIETRTIDTSKVIKRLADSADRLLLDVPCSGLGVLKRHPDTKWKLNPNELLELQKTQSELLDRYSTMVKVGGLMVYATCSIAPSENEGQIAKFTKRNPKFELEQELQVSPVETEFDGFYAARLRRIN